MPWSTSYSFNYSSHVPPGVHSHSPFRLPRPLVTDTHSCTLLRCCCFLYNPTQSSHERVSLPDNKTHLKPHLYTSSPVSLKKKKIILFLSASLSSHHHIIIIHKLARVSFLNEFLEVLIFSLGHIFLLLQKKKRA